MLTTEQIKDNFDKYCLLLEKLTEPRKSIIMSYISDNADNVASSPANRFTDIGYCYYGGFVEKTLKLVEVAKHLHGIWSKYTPITYNGNELLFSAILCELGKVLHLNKPVLVENTVDWEVKKGILFKNNPEVPFMKNSDRTLYNLSHIGVPVSENEFYAIKLYQGLYEEENKGYIMSNSDLKNRQLHHLIHQASLISNQ